MSVTFHGIRKAAPTMPPAPSPRLRSSRFPAFFQVLAVAAAPVFFLPAGAAGQTTATAAVSPAAPPPASVPAAPVAPPPPIPPSPREFRGLWITTFFNIDWPSRKSDPSKQREELIAIFDKARAARFNAVFLQVRPCCDAFYKSPYEPWSEYLTGKQGTPPTEDWDPLAFAVAEAHKRGLELHAWFNPYRAATVTTTETLAPTHLARARPDLVRAYGKRLLLDPSEPAVQSYAVSVVMDVVKRYDVDGVHFDDYFYPDLLRGADKQPIQFPDQPNYERYKADGGTLPKDDWRRDQVNMLVRRIAKEVRATGRPVKFGISPFGIWRPDHPKGVRGKDAYAELYADSRQWLRDGTVDYLIPQLYWKMGAPGHGFEELLAWWTSQNPTGRHVWAGLASFKVKPAADGWAAADILAQVAHGRGQKGTGGFAFYNATSLMEDRDGLAEKLAAGPFGGYALTPAFPWIDGAAPPAPAVAAEATGAGPVTARWAPGDREALSVWAVYANIGGTWRMTVIPAGQTSAVFGAGAAAPTAVAVAAVDRAGNESARTIARVVRR